MAKKKKVDYRTTLGIDSARESLGVVELTRDLPVVHKKYDYRTTLGIDSVRESLGIVETPDVLSVVRKRLDYRTTLGIDGTRESLGIIEYINESVPSTIVYYNVSSIESEETFGSIFYYKFTIQKQEAPYGGGGGPLNVVHSKEPWKRAPDFGKHKQIFIVQPIISEEEFSDIKYIEYFSLSSIKNKTLFGQVSFKKSTIEDEETLILMLLAA
jgi:hypothetical protein